MILSLRGKNGRGMGSIKKQNVRQDLQDYLAKRAFGSTVSIRRRKKIPFILKILSKKKLKSNPFNAHRPCGK
jgi:hypothetical protein